MKDEINDRDETWSWRQEPPISACAARLIVKGFAGIVENTALSMTWNAGVVKHMLALVNGISKASNADSSAKNCNGEAMGL